MKAKNCMHKWPHFMKKTQVLDEKKDNKTQEAGENKE